MQAQLRVGCGLFQVKSIVRNFVFCNDLGERFPTSKWRFKYIMIRVEAQDAGSPTLSLFVPFVSHFKISLAPQIHLHMDLHYAWLGTILKEHQGIIQIF